MPECMYGFTLYRPREGIVEQRNLGILDYDKMVARMVTENEVPTFMFKKTTADVSMDSLKDFLVWRIEPLPKWMGAI